MDWSKLLFMLKKTFLFFLLILSLRSFCFEAQVSTAVFYNQVIGSYVEIYTWIPAWQLATKLQKDSTYKSQVEVLVLLKGDSTNVIADKFNLNSRVMSSANDNQFCLIDLKRYNLKPGTYKLQLHFKDLNATNSEANFIAQEITIPIDTQKVFFSDIELVDTFYSSSTASSFVKNDIVLKPKVIEFFSTDENKLTFYTELYHIDKILLPEEKFLLKTSIINQAGEEQTILTTAKKMSVAPVIPVLQTMNIAELRTGNYYIQIEAIDRSNKNITRQVIFIQRLNLNIKDTIDINTYNNANNFGKGFLDTATIAYLQFSVASITPISTYKEIPYLQTLSRSPDSLVIKEYLSRFWRGVDPLNPEYAWKKYEEQVTWVEREYRTPTEHGFSTDRGRVYLQYGAPNEKSRNNNSGGYNYEVWQYYKLPDGQSKVIFVFYNPTLTNNGMQLLHSNARGELQDPNWKQKIGGANASDFDMDGRNNRNGVNGNTNRSVNDF
jgi:GWxTD domain-containing protein